MTIQSSIRRKIATQHVYDKMTGLDLTLPAPYQIVFYHDRAWNGGTLDGKHYLLIERMATGNGHIPTILADGDLDMFLVSTGIAKEKIDIHTQGINVAGQIGGKDVEGYIAMVRYDDEHSYLVFVAAEYPARAMTLRHDAVAIAAMITGKRS